MNPEVHKKLIEDNLPGLVSCLDLLEVFDRLRSRRVITEAKEKDIKSKHDQKKELLDYMQKRPEADFITFCAILIDTNQQFIVERYFPAYLDKAKGRVESLPQPIKGSDDGTNSIIGDKHQNAAPLTGNEQNSEEKTREKKEEASSDDGHHNVVSFMGNDQKDVDGYDSGAESNQSTDSCCITLKDSLYLKAEKLKEKLFSSTVLEEAKEKKGVHSAAMKLFHAIQQGYLKPGCIERNFRFFHSSKLSEFMKMHEAFKKLSTELISSELKDTIGSHDIITVPRIKNEKQCTKVLEKMRERELDLHCSVSDGEEEVFQHTGPVQSLKRRNSTSDVQVKPRTRHRKVCVKEAKKKIPIGLEADQPIPGEEEIYKSSYEGLRKEIEDSNKILQKETERLEKYCKEKQMEVLERKDENTVLMFACNLF